MRNFLIICIALLLVLCINSNVLAIETLYETSSQQIINSGTILTKYNRLTDKGWLAINVIKVNLRDSNTSVGVLTSENGLSTFQNVRTMLERRKNCIAAVNADFFTGNYKKGNIIGMTINDGKILTSTSAENGAKNVLASFYIDSNAKAFADYFSNKITLKSLNTNDVYEIAEINKWSSDYEYPVLHTKEWGEKTPGNSYVVNMTEMIVENNVVKEIRDEQEGVELSDDEYAICTIGNSAEKLKNMFKPGDKVELNIEVGLDVSKIKLAVSGGALLVKDGKPIEEFSHMIYGSNPRTAVGTSQDGSIMYLVTIDGRQHYSVGVTQAELAQILVEKGLYNAINLDGGGSTTMVARELGDNTPTVENSPSEGTLRMVPNAIGVFNTTRTGSLKEIIVESEEPNVFVGGERMLTVKGYDKYYNPVEIDNDDIEWACDGVKATVEDGILKVGDEAGTVTVKATIEDVIGETSVDVLSAPNELIIYPKKITTSSNENVTFKVSGQNKNGYSSNLNNNEVIWDVSGESASIKDGVFKASRDGSYIVQVSAGDAVSYAIVNVNTNVSKVVNDFENNNFKFVNYPSEVKGSVKLSDEEVFEGKKSAKLNYDFTGTSETRGAYLRFNEPVVIDSNVLNLKVNFYSANSTKDKVKVRITDSNNETKYLTLAKSIESNGWQELSLGLKDVSLPAKLIDLYVVQDAQDQFTSGSVYFDNLRLEYNSEFVDTGLNLPKDIKGLDTANVSGESQNSFNVVVSPKFYNGLLLEHLKNKNMENVINKNSEIVIYPYKSGDEMLVNISKEKVIGNAYTISNYKSLSIVTLNILDGGIRDTDGSQWKKLQEDIKNVNKNLLIVLNGNIDDFKDELERQLFINVLCDFQRSYNKNIWVIQKGDNIDYSMNRGVRYLTINSSILTEELTLEDIRKSQYIMINVTNDNMTYQVKKAF